jgi:Berberine and berberine like.
LIPLKFAADNVIKSYQLLESLAFSRSMGYTNYLLGKNINLVRDNETSVHPSMRKSLFLITANQIGNDKLISVLPNNVTGVSKNHVGPLGPNWRESIWGEQYERLLEIKNMIDPTKVLSCYQSVGYTGDEVDVDTVEDRLIPTPSPGKVDVTLSGVSILTGIKAVVLTSAVAIYLLYGILLIKMCDFYCDLN